MEIEKLSEPNVGDNASLQASQASSTSQDPTSSEPPSRPIEELVSEIGVKLRVPQQAIEEVIQKLKNGWFYTEDSLLSSNLEKIVDMQLPTKLLEELKERQKMWKKQKIVVFPKRDIKPQNIPRERKSKEPKDDEDYFDVVVEKISEWHQEMNFSDQVATVLSTHEIICHPCSWYYGKQMIKRLKRAGEVCNWKQHCLGRHPQHDPDFSTGHMQHYMLWLDAGKPDLIEGRPRGLEPGALSEDAKKRKLMLGGNNKSAFKKLHKITERRMYKGPKSKKIRLKMPDSSNSADPNNQGSASEGEDEPVAQTVVNNSNPNPLPPNLPPNILASFAFPGIHSFPPPQTGWNTGPH